MSHDPITDAAALPEAVDVLVVGGGPVGSAVAVELARRGRPPLVLERREAIPTVGVRARNISLRTMELARRWGIAGELRAARTLPDAWYRGWQAVTSVAGHRLGARVRDDVPMWSPTAPWREIGAEPPLDLPQQRFHRVVRDHAERLGARFATGWTVEEVDQDDEGATVTARRADGAVRAVRAAWVVGADGSRSAVRRAAGIEQDASEPVGRMLNVGFRFPDAFAQAGVEPGIQFMVFNRHVSGLAHPYEPDRWRIGMGPIPLDVDHEALDLEREIRRYLGFDARIDEISVSTHLVQRRVARSYRAGRILLAGDAAATFPPHLGQNLNAGVADAAMLGWILDALLAGWGGEELLEAYDHERREAVHQITGGTLDAVADWLAIERLRTAPELEDETPAGERARAALGEAVAPLMGSAADGVIFDLRHPGSPIVVGDGTAPPPFDPRRVHPAALAGHRAPHVWLGDGEPLSDRFGPGFTLLDLGAAPADVAALTAAAGHLPLRVLSIDAPAVREAYAAPLVLIRPDHVVAWRGDRAPADPAALLAIVAGRGGAGGAEPANARSTSTDARPTLASAGSRPTDARPTPTEALA